MKYEILLYYKYVKVNRPQLFVDWHKELCKKLNLKGRILIAEEGINGTVEGEPHNTAEYMKALTAQDSKGTPDKYGNAMNSDGSYSYGDFSDVVFKRSEGGGNSFPKMRIKLRKEIVALGLGQNDVNPAEKTGTHLPADQLRQWILDGKKFEIIDMRNDYEFVAGHFKNSINTEMTNFRDLPKALPKVLEKNPDLKEKTVLTVCTGGIRCEKASAYLLQQGFKDVYQLGGGMATYMEKYPGQDFLGSLYVFDNRVLMNFDNKVSESNSGKLHEIIGHCAKCQEKSERYINCANDFCHLHFICCEKCANPDGRSYCGITCRQKHLFQMWREKFNNSFNTLVKKVSTVFHG